MSLRDFRKVYDAHFAFVWRTLRRLGVPERDLPDVVQEVFLIVHRRLPDFEERARITTWLFRICFRSARDRRRRAHVRREVIDHEVNERADGNHGSPDDLLQRRRDLQLLESALTELNLDQRAVFLLFELEAMTGEEIAEALEIPLGTVYSRLRLARTAFRRALKRELARRREHPQLTVKTS